MTLGQSLQTPSSRLFPNTVWCHFPSGGLEIKGELFDYHNHGSSDRATGDEHILAKDTEDPVKVLGQSHLNQDFPHLNDNSIPVTKHRVKQRWHPMH